MKHLVGGGLLLGIRFPGMSLPTPPDPSPPAQGDNKKALGKGCSQSERTRIRNFALYDLYNFTKVCKIILIEFYAVAISEVNYG